MAGESYDWFEKLKAQSDSQVATIEQPSEENWFDNLKKQSNTQNPFFGSVQDYNQPENAKTFLGGVYNAAKKGSLEAAKMPSQLFAMGQNIGGRDESSIRWNAARGYSFAHPATWVARALYGTNPIAATEKERNKLTFARAQLDQMTNEIRGTKEGEKSFWSEGGWKEPVWYAERFAELAPSLSLQLASAAGGGAGMAVMTGAQTAASQYEAAEKRLLSKGVAPEKAAKEAAGEALKVGIVTAAIDKIGFSKLFSKAGSSFTLKKGMESALTEAVTETAQEFSAMVSETGTDTRLGLPDANQFTWENVGDRLAPAGVLGAITGPAFGGSSSAVGDVTPRIEGRYSLTPEDATRLVRENPEAAQAVAQSSRAGVNDFAKWGVERGQGNRKEATAQRKKFQEEVKRQLDVVAQEARQQQEANSVAQPAGPEASVLNPNQTDVQTADAQAPQVIDQTQTTEEAPVRAAEKMLARKIARALPGDTNANADQVLQQLRQDPEGLKQELEGNPGAESLIQKIEGYQERQVAQQETQRQPDELPVKNEGFTILPIPQFLQKKTFWNGVKSLMKSARSLGHRTKEHRQLQEQQFSNIHSQVKQSQWQARDFRQAMEEHYGVKAYRQIPMQERAKILEALNTPAQLASLPDKIRIPMMAMRATIDALSQKMKPFLAKDLQLVIDAKTGMYTVRAYRVWEEKNYSIEDVPEDILRDGINYLQSISTLNVSDAEMRKLVTEYIASRGDKNFTIRGDGDSRVDMTSLLKRQEIPKELRNLMGEYTDPDAVFQHTVAKLATMAETFQFQQNIVDVGLNGNPDQKFLWRQDDLSRPDGLVKIEIDESEKARKPLGAIAGLMTFPEVRDILLGRDKMRPHSWSMQGLAAASLATKLGKTVVSPATSIRNVMSGIGFMVKNGHIFEGEAWKALWNEMSGKGFTVRDTWGANPTAFSKAKAIEYIEAGITGKEVTSNEIREMWELMSKQTATDNLFSQAGASNVLRQLSRGDDAAAEHFGKWWGRIKRFYLNGDTLWKIVTYEGEKARLRKQGMTDEAAIRNAAAEITKNTTPDYDRVWGWVKPLRKTPIVATFPSFAAEMLRNNYEILKQGGYELREGARTGNRAMQVSGAKRLIGLMSYTAVPIGASILASSLSDVSNEEDDAVRELDPPWMRNNFWFYVGRDEKTGQPIRFDITNLYTDQNIIKPMIALAHRGEPWEAAWEVVSPFFGWDLHTQAAIESVANVDFDTGRRISNPQASAGQQVPDRIWHYLSQVQPGLTQQGMQIVDSYNGKLNRDGKKVSPNAAWGRLAGVRFHSMDPETQIKYLVYGYRDATIHADSGFTSLAKEKSKPSKEKLVRRYLHMEAERRYVFDDMVNKVKAGVTLTDTRTVFDALGGHGVKSSLSKERKLRLIAGEYEPWQFDEDFIRAVPKENRQTVLEAIQEARQILANPTASRNAGGLLSPQLPPE